jgi:AraC-like DNA-binding protein
MARAHDRASGLLVPSSDFGVEDDPLSDVLAQVKLTGALFFLIEATEPWGVEVPKTASFADVVVPGAQHIVSYDVVLEGEGWVELPEAEPEHFGPGDVLVFPQSQPHRLVSAPGQRPEYNTAATVAFLREMAAGRLPFLTREGGGGRLTRYVCGYLGCDLRPFNPVLAALPPFLLVRRRHTEPNLLDRLIALTLEEASANRYGGRSIRLRLSELIFVEVVRRYVEEMAPEERGWLAGLRDPVVGRALALLHSRPAEHWTLELLSRETAVSRAILSERFSHVIGCPPIQYLTRWRMQIGGRMLTESRGNVATVAEAVGYASEAAFSRAFKRETGVTPADWRARRRC